MSTWTRTDQQGIRVHFTITPDERGNITLTQQEVEGLMRAGGWKPGSHTAAAPVHERDRTLGQMSPMFR